MHAPGPSRVVGAPDVAGTNLLAFFLLTFALTWAAWLLSAALAGPNNAGFFGVRGPIFLVGVFAPALVAIALTMTEGHAGVRRLIARIGRWQVRTRWYVFAVGYLAAGVRFVDLLSSPPKANTRDERSVEENHKG